MAEGGGIEPLRFIAVPQVSGLVASHLAAPSEDWSGWQDLNLRSLRPRRSALPASLHPDRFWWTGSDLNRYLIGCRPTVFPS